MNVTFYTFTKRINSLSVPSGGTAITVKLKQGTDVLSPTLLLSSQVNPTAWNYAYIPDFGRRYFVKSWLSVRDMWECQLEVDVLGSWAEQIKTANALVLFSSSDYNLDLLDNRIAARGSYTENTIDYDFVGTLSGQQLSPGGSFCVTTLAQDSNWASGVATTYFMTYQQMQQFAGSMLNPDFVEQLKQYFTNPFDGLIDCYYLPFDAGLYCDLSLAGPVWLGSYQVPGTSARKPIQTSLAVKSKSVTMQIPWVYSDFRNLPPYTSIELFVPFCGSKSLDPGEFYGQESLLVTYSIDVNVGAVQAVVSTEKRTVQEFSGNCKVSLPIGQSQSRAESIIGGLGGAITAVSGFGGGNVALGATGVLSAISSVLSPQQVRTMGGMSGSVLGAILGNATTLYQNFRLSVVGRNASDNPAAIRPVQGNVLNAVKSIGSLSGYCQTSGFSLSAPAYQSEIDRVNTYMDGGVYL